MLWLAWRLIAGFFALPRGRWQAVISAASASGAAARPYGAAGLVAAAAGDSIETARREALARRPVRVLGDDPLAQRLLEAQAAQLAGDHGRVRPAVPGAMAEQGDCPVLGLRGLYVEALGLARARAAAGARSGGAGQCAQPGAGLGGHGGAGRPLGARGDWLAVERLIDSQRRVKASTSARRRSGGRWC